MTDHVFLVAISIDTEGDRADAEAILDVILPLPGHGGHSMVAGRPAPHVARGTLAEWWVAEDDRRSNERSNDSAVFVHMGHQQEAHDLLLANRLVFSHCAPVSGVSA